MLFRLLPFEFEFRRFRYRSGYIARRAAENAEAFRRLEALVRETASGGRRRRTAAPQADCLTDGPVFHYKALVSDWWYISTKAPRPKTRIRPSHNTTQRAAARGTSHCAGTHGGIAA